MATLEDLAPETRDELAMLARELSDNPKTRKSFLKLAKEVHPSMPAPEIDLDDRIAALEAGNTDRVSKLENQLAERDMRAELDRRRNALIERGLADDLEDVRDIEKLMLDKNISSHDTAAEYRNWMRQAAPSTPPSYDRNFITKSDQDRLKPYWKNPAAAARESAASALQEIRSGKIKFS